MPNIKTVPVNGPELRKLLTIKGYNLSEASRIIGRGASFFSKVTSENEMGVTNIYAIENAFGIKYEDYAPVIEEQMEADLNAQDSEIKAILAEINSNLAALIDLLGGAK